LHLVGVLFPHTITLYSHVLHCDDENMRCIWKWRLCRQCKPHTASYEAPRHRRISVVVGVRKMWM